MDIRPIRTDADHEAALREISRLWDAPEGSDEADKLDVLATLVEVYEGNRWPIEEKKDPIELIKYLIDETGRSRRDLASIIGSQSRASEILARKRALTIDMIDKISRAWNIPVKLLAVPYAIAKTTKTIKTRRSKVSIGLRLRRRKKAAA